MASMHSQRAYDENGAFVEIGDEIAEGGYGMILQALDESNKLFSRVGMYHVSPEKDELGNCYGESFLRHMFQDVEKTTITIV
jgi:hypothetical protein